jgi:uncharacterized protein (TIGR01777 family)
MNKKIIITGGTGFLGQSLVEDLVKGGYECVVYTRSPDKYKSDNNIVYREWMEDEDYLKSEINGSYAVINLAGAPVIGKRWSEEYKKTIIDSRVDTTNALVNAMNNCSNPPKRFLSSSASGYFGDRGNEVLDEESESGNTFLAEVCEKWEAEAEKIEKNIQLIILRTGVVLHPDGGALQQIMKPFKYYVGGSIGTGNQYISWITLADWKRFLIFALEKNGISQKNNLGSPNAVTMNVLTSTIGWVYNKPSIFKVPTFLVKMVLGEASSTVLDSQRMEPKNILEANFKYNHNLIDEAIKSFKNS